MFWETVASIRENKSVIAVMDLKGNEYFNMQYHIMKRKKKMFISQNICTQQRKDVSIQLHLNLVTAPDILR